MRVDACALNDLPLVQSAYETGRTLQRAQQSAVWPVFPDAAIIRAIETGALFKVVGDGALIGVFSMIADDALIWGDLEQGEHLYLHRIARASSLSVGGLMNAILDWAWRECDVRGCAGLRMDTWAGSDALIAYYATLGFQQVGTQRLPSDPRLAPHYHGIELALLEASRDPKHSRA